MKKSFWRTLNRAKNHGWRFSMIAEARVGVFQCTEVFYNGKCKHSSLKYVRPESFEASWNPV